MLMQTPSAVFSYGKGSSCELPAEISESGKFICALLKDSKGIHLSKWSTESSSVTSKREPTRRVTLNDWKSHKASSLHTLSSSDGQEFVALIFESKGKSHVAWTHIDGQEESSISTLALTDKIIFSAAHGGALAIASQSSSEAGQINVHLYSFKQGKISPTRSIQFTPPEAKALATQLCLQALSYVAIAWSDGTVSVIKMDGPQFNMKAAVSSPGQQEEQQGGRKRKTAKSTSQSTTFVQMSAYDSTRILISHLSGDEEGPQGAEEGPQGAHRGFSHSLLDVRYGCWGPKISLDLDPSILEEAEASDPSSRQVVVLESKEGVVAALRFGGALVGVRLDDSPSSLLSLLGQMKFEQPVSSCSQVDISSLKAFQLSQSKAPSSLVAASDTLVSSGDSEKDDGSLVTELHDLACLLNPSLAGSSGLPNKASLDKTIQKGVVRVKRSKPPIDLLPLLLQLMSFAGCWKEIEDLLAHGSDSSSLSCIKSDLLSGVLASAVAAKQFTLLGPLCSLMLTSDAETPPRDLTSVLHELLSPTTASNQAPRKSYHALLRDKAQAVIARSEEVISSKNVEDPSASSVLSASKAQREAIDLARCAAASVDGFTPRESTLHPLLSLDIDPPALQTSLSKLSNNEVDTLMEVLAKWAEKYSNDLGEGSSFATKALKASHLLIPTYAKVLEWVQVLLDSHLSRLLMANELPPAVGRLMTCIKTGVLTCQQLMPLLGATEHIRQRAPLPAAHVAAATQYTVELLSL